jgi:Na+-translocating ferredoxin:NAD+ oxidoreductase RnfC subunit
MKPVEEGMEIFPCPVEPDKAVEPVANADALTLQSVFPTVNRCTKCGSCTTACPMSIPVMDSVMRMQEGSFDKVAEDFTTCIHCGLCRFVCEDKVKPHSMGLWIRRSLGKSQVELQIDVENSDRVEKEWQYLLVEDKQERMQRAKIFREYGGLPE